MGEADTDNQGRLKLDEECVVCLAAAATMQTFPCGHKVVCRKCLIKTIQVAVSQRCLPLRCVICRDRILRLHHTIHGQGTPTSLSTSLTPPLTLSSRSASSPLTPTSPTSLFSLITGAKSQYNSPRLLSPTSASVQALHSPTSSITSDTASKLSRLSPTPLEEDFVHYTPSDVEAFVSSHNDALNLHTHEPLRGNSPEDQLRHMAKHSGGHHSLFSSKRHEASSHGFMHPPSVKIHPEAACQPNAFLQSPVESNPVPMALSQASSSQKPTSASKFFAKLLPKTSRRKCSWFKHE